MPKMHFLIACGAPLRQKKHLSSEIILDRLKKVKVIDELEVSGVGTCVIFTGFRHRATPETSPLRARLITEAVLLKAVRMWLRNLGMVSYDKVMIRDENDSFPKVSTFPWDLTGPSYLQPMSEWSKTGTPTPGFIACDVFLGATMTESGLSPFLRKCSTLRNLRKVGRCLQIFVANRYSQDAFRTAKKHGIIPATPESLFGSEVAKGLTQLNDVLTQAAKASINPEVFNELFQRLGKIEGVATNLRGSLFEYITAELVRCTISSNVTLNQTVMDRTGAKAEIDVQAIQSNRAIYFIECKGYQPSGTINTEIIERWLTQQVPRIRKIALQHPDWKNLELHFEFWTTGKLSKEAETMMKSAKTDTKKYTIEFRDADAVYKYAQATKDKSLITTLKQHFLVHPMSTVEKDIEKQTKKRKHVNQHNTISESVPAVASPSKEPQS